MTEHSFVHPDEFDKFYQNLEFQGVEGRRKQQSAIKKAKM
jgi:hypothetical protein